MWKILVLVIAAALASCTLDEPQTAVELEGKKDAPNMSRCHFCAERCDDEGQWPKVTYAGRDCGYWLKKYKKRDPRGGCYG